MRTMILASAIILASACAAHADSYADGRRDWTDLKNWQNSLGGPYRQGVEWWAGNRSVVGHSSCEDTPEAYMHGPNADLEFRAGCKSSRDRLATIDARRSTDPAYRNGFNDGARNAPWPVASQEPIPALSPSKTPENACYDAFGAMKRIMQRQMNDRDADINFDLEGARYDGQETYRCFLRATYRGDDFQSNMTVSVTKNAKFKVEMLSNGRSYVTLLP